MSYVVRNNRRRYHDGYNVVRYVKERREDELRTYTMEHIIITMAIAMTMTMTMMPYNSHDIVTHTTYDGYELLLLLLCFSPLVTHAALILARRPSIRISHVSLTHHSTHHTCTCQQQREQQREIDSSHTSTSTSTSTRHTCIRTLFSCCCCCDVVCVCTCVVCVTL